MLVEVNFGTLKKVPSEDLEYISNKYSGTEFNKIFNFKKFYKLTTKDEIHNNYLYVDGLNEEEIIIDDNNVCSKGGLYFTDVDNICCWLHYKTYGTLKFIHWKRQVIIPDDAIVVTVLNAYKPSKYYTNKFILGPRQYIYEDIDEIVDGIKKNPNFLRYLKDINSLDQPNYEKICCELLKINGYYFNYIPLKFQTAKMFDVALEYNKELGFIEYVSDRFMTDDKIMIMVKKDPHILAMFLSYSKEVAFEAVKTDPSSLQWIFSHEKYYEELCKFAVSLSSVALEFVCPKVQNYNEIRDLARKNIAEQFVKINQSS